MNHFEQLCRAVCRAEGHDPDEIVTLSRIPQIGAKGRVVHAGSAGAVPSWSLYGHEVVSILGALKDLGYLSADEHETLMELPKREEP